MNFREFMKAEVQLPRTPSMRSSQNPQKAKFAEFLFHALRWIRMRSKDWDTVPLTLKRCVVLSLYDHPVTHKTEGVLMFDSLTSKVVTAVCAVIGAIALLSIFFLAVTGGSPYLQFGLALVFFAMFIVGSYWWMVFGSGRNL
jgi:hypothetical protein